MKYLVRFYFETRAFEFEVTADTPVDALIDAKEQYKKKLQSTRTIPPFYLMKECIIKRTSHLNLA